MSKTILEIKQLADSNGGNSIAPITVPEAILFENGSSFSDLVGDTDISSIGDGSLTSAISAIKNKSYAFYKFPADTNFSASITSRNHVLTITTSGRPVFLSICGDLNPTTADNAWFGMRFYRDDIQLCYQICEIHGNSWNNPFSMQYLDIVPAGTYNYKITFERGAGTFTFTEGGAIQSPNFIVFEI